MANINNLPGQPIILIFWTWTISRIIDILSGNHYYEAGSHNYEEGTQLHFLLLGGVCYYKNILNADQQCVEALKCCNLRCSSFKDHATTDMHQKAMNFVWHRPKMWGNIINNMHLLLELCSISILIQRLGSILCSYVKYRQYKKMSCQ